MEETKRLRTTYAPPKITLLTIAMEQGIAKSSAILRPGDIYHPDQPVTQDWNDKGVSGSKDFDM
ncbi:hypothetical protein [Sphingobacterium sp. R2]|uniref:hypothetical protein n=1 Tax=Sphingobacterium sp. R2 TaxID=3112958 RepID=UPI00345E004C